MKLPEPVYYLATNGRLLQTADDVDQTGLSIVIYTEAQMRWMYQKAIQDAVDSYSPDDTAMDFMDKLFDLKEQANG